MRYEVTPDLLTDNELIDSEHRQLFAAINRLLDAFSNKTQNGNENILQATTFLQSYVDRHFGHEEDLQKKYEWREYEMHHKFHEEYKETLDKILGKIPKEGPSIDDMSAINTHVVRLITHIRTMDKRLGAYIKTQKAR